MRKKTCRPSAARTATGTFCKWAVLDSNPAPGAREKQGSQPDAVQNPVHAATDPDLARVVAVWDNLPAELRARILALIEGT